MRKKLAALTLMSLISLASANSATREDATSIIKGAGFEMASCQNFGMGKVCAYLKGSPKSAQDKLHTTATKLGWKLKGKWEQDPGLRVGTYVKGAKFVNVYVIDQRPLSNLAFISSNFDDKP